MVSAHWQAEYHLSLQLVRFAESPAQNSFLQSMAEWFKMISSGVPGQMVDYDVLSEG
jgi:hypothetical protein